MHLFYTPDINSDNYTLNQEESRHCTKVLRLSEDDIIYLTDGLGNLYKTKIIDANPKKCKVQVVKTKHNYQKRDYYLHVAIAPTKNMDRLEWFLEKATEIGIDEITPIITENSERRIVKHERIFKKITSAVKQSLSAYHPKLNQLKTYKEFMAGCNFDGNKFIAHCYNYNLEHLKNKAESKTKVLILIGPEGDFSKKEVQTAIDNNFEEILLGKSRLRTETAGIVAVNIINLLNS